jgi:hypothetical protein
LFFYFSLFYFIFYFILFFNYSRDNGIVYLIRCQCQYRREGERGGCGECGADKDLKFDQIWMDGSVQGPARERREDRGSGSGHMGGLRLT